jgi:hypothetical protein
MAPLTASAAGSAAVFAQTAGGVAPLPAGPPIGGFIWTVVIPAVLFLGSFLGTFLLYKRFAEEDGE